MAAATYCRRSDTPRVLSRRTSLRSRTTKSISTPPPSRKLNPCPSASGTTRMSLKIIAASKLNRRTGCNVTSAANSGTWISSRKVYFSLRARYSARQRPAWRISQTGGRSTGKHFRALTMRCRPVFCAGVGCKGASPQAFRNVSTDSKSCITTKYKVAAGGASLQLANYGHFLRIETAIYG